MTLQWIRTPCGESSHCLEVAADGDLVYIRSSEEMGTIRCSRGEWDAFRQAVILGAFEKPR